MTLKQLTMSVAADRSALGVSGAAEGTATITVTAEDADGNRASDAVDVTVVKAPEPEPEPEPVELPGPVLGLELTATQDSVSVSRSAPESPTSGGWGGPSPRFRPPHRFTRPSRPGPALGQGAITRIKDTG